jgi:hypothetical protein
MATGAYMIDGRLNDGWVDYIRTLLTNLLWFLVNKAEVCGKRGGSIVGLFFESNLV